MKICVTGNGNIGSRLIQMGCEPISLNLLNEESVREAVRDSKADCIIHAAGITSPEACEKEPELARLTNFRGTIYLCEAAEEIRAKVLYLSSDYVFDGLRGDYSEDEEPSPINEYGRTKLAAEGVFQLYEGKILRLSRGFDENSADLKGYGLALGTGNIYVPDFIFRSYSHFNHLAEGVMAAAKMYDEIPNILHVASQDSMSFYDFVLRVAKVRGWNTNAVLPRREEDSGFTQRPLRGGLDTRWARKLGVPIYTTNESIGLLK